MNLKKVLMIGWAVCLFAIVFGSAMFYLIAYTNTYENIRNPENDHYHFRMQIIVNGEAVNFAEERFQKAYSKDLCTADLTEEPIHFHDNRDQLVHIHWEGISGGQVLKFYGWNEIGGLPGTLGFTLNNLKQINNVQTHGNLLPQRPQDANYFVYVGDNSFYEEKFWDDFINKDLERFFGKSYDDNDKNQSLLNFLIPEAYAHDGQDHVSEGEKKVVESLNTITEQKKLEDVNTLIGNVVIFVQNARPTDEQIKDRFNQLVPLTESTCAG